MTSRRMPKSVSAPVAGHAEPASPLPVAAVLSFLKRRGESFSWSLKDLTKSLGISTAEGRRAAALLQVQGYIERTGDDEWLTTDSGTAVSGSKPPRLVAPALSALGERIRAVNHDPNAPFHIRNAVAFGDFLSGRARVQAPDVGIHLVSRILRVIRQT